MYLELIVRSYLSISMFVICGLTVCIDTIGKDITPFRRYYATRCQAAKNRVDVGSYPQHLSLHRTYGSRIRRYIHIGERKL